MILTRLRLQNVRRHSDLSINLSPRVTLITGSNGSGKTTCLESITVALQGSSFKGRMADLVRDSAPWFRIDTINDQEFARTVKYTEVAGRQFIVDGKMSSRLSKKDKYPIVLFEPEDLRLIGGSPSRRRDFFDRFIAQVDPGYSTILSRYDRALKQRNKLLKQPGMSAEMLFPWNITLSEYGAKIIGKRHEMIEMINDSLQATYRDISQKNDEVSISYHHATSSQSLLRQLEESLDRDLLLRQTTIGPHRHDITLRFNGHLASEVASRGEVRTIILALKFIELHIIEELTGNRPLILLDDVFGELDASRQKNLAQTFSTHQVIITTTEKIKHLPRETRVIQL